MPESHPVEMMIQLLWAVAWASVLFKSPVPVPIPGDGSVV